MAKMINFRHVNAEGDFAKLLDHHGLEYTKKGAQLRLCCPFHEDANPSLSITLDATDQAQPNTFHCFGCGESGSLIDFESKLSNVDLRTAAETVATVSGCSLAASRGARGGKKRQKAPVSRRKGGDAEKAASPAPAAATGAPDASEAVSGSNKPLNFALTLDLGHECVLRRLDPEAAEYFGVGHLADTSRSMMKGRICIPIHNALGELVAYAGRWADEDVPDDEDKYLFPPKFKKSAELFNLHRLTAKDQHIVVVEGFFGAMRLHQLGVPVVALMGTAISDEQVLLLRQRGVRSALVLLDGDEPGRKASEAVGLALMHHLFARVVHLPDDGAPDDLDEDTLGAFLPYWRLRNRF